MTKKGIVYLVGAGPGDPKLITLRAQELLQQADIVAYDHLVSARILKHARPEAKMVYVGKEADRHTKSQQTINQLLVRAAKSGKTVIRLKGGDPFLFGRGAEEAQELVKAGVSFEIVPGVTSAIAVPAYAGIAVTHRDYASSVAIVTGHEDPAKTKTAIHWDRLATAVDTLVLLMSVGNLGVIARKLIAHGRKPTTPAAVIEWGTLSRQKTVTAPLARIAASARRKGIGPPAVVVVGEVVSLRKKLAWFEKRPLIGQRILVTRALDKAAVLSDRLEALGAEVEELPAIELASVHANGAFSQAVAQLPDTDWVFFTSPEGVHWFKKMLKDIRRDLRSLKDCHIAAIGPKTADSLEACGVHVDFIPRQFSQEGILDDFPKRVLQGKRAVIFSAKESRDVLESGLRKQGMQVSRLPIYETKLPKESQRRALQVFEQPFHWVTVTSASCVDHLMQVLKEAGKPGLFKKLCFASIGPVTSKAIRKLGGRVAVEAKVSTIEGLIEALTRRAK